MLNTFPPTLAASLVRYFLSLDLWVECYVNGHAWIHRATLEKGPDHYEIPENKRLFVQKPYRIAEDLPESLVCEQMAVEKINLPYLPPALRTMLWQKMDGMPDVTAVSSVDDNMELNVTPDAIKATACGICAKNWISPLPMCSPWEITAMTLPCYAPQAFRPP